MVAPHCRAQLSVCKNSASATITCFIIIITATLAPGTLFGKRYNTFGDDSNNYTSVSHHPPLSLVSKLEGPLWITITISLTSSNQDLPL